MIDSACKITAYTLEMTGHFGLTACVASVATCFSAAVFCYKSFKKPFMQPYKESFDKELYQVDLDMNAEELPAMSVEPLPEERFRIKSHLLPTRFTPAEDPRHLLFETEILTLEQLKNGIKLCAEVFSDLIGQRPYAIACKEKKSSWWVGDYALNFLTNKPVEKFEHASDSHNYGLGDDILEMKTDCLVIFEDSAFGGV